MSLIFVVFQMLQVYLLPWRTLFPNMIDAALSTSMVLLMVCVAVSGDFHDTASLVGLVGTVIIFAALAWSVVGIGIGMYKWLVPSPFYQWFICHHKADAAGQARYLQLLLTEQTWYTCFIDSDHLIHLDDLLAPFVTASAPW